MHAPVPARTDPLTLPSLTLCATPWRPHATTSQLCVTRRSSSKCSAAVASHKLRGQSSSAHSCCNATVARPLLLLLPVVPLHWYLALQVAV